MLIFIEDLLFPAFLILIIKIGFKIYFDLRLMALFMDALLELCLSILGFIVQASLKIFRSIHIFIIRLKYDYPSTHLFFRIFRKPL